METTFPSSLGLCVPKWSTRRRFERPTWGPYWGRVAAALGKSYMPWQQYVADIAGEVNPETGELCYSRIVLTVPRQSGKTTLMLPIVVGRAEAGAAFGGRQRMVYAAQTREDARRKWNDDYVEDLHGADRMQGRYKVRLGTGSENVTFHHSRSMFGPIATKDTSGHGQVLDLGCLDETFAQDDGAVEGAWSPATVTRPMAQLWFPSTRGTEAAVYHNQMITDSRLAAEVDPGYGTAYVEWSADPDWAKAEPGDHALWATCMPAMGRTQSSEALDRQFQNLSLAEWTRAFLNLVVPKLDPPVLDPARWAATRRPDVKRATRPVLAVDVSYDRKTACIAMGSLADDGSVLVRVADYREGTGWLIARLKQLRDELDPARIVFDGAGPVRSMLAEARMEWLDHHVLTASDMTAACGMFYDVVHQQGEGGRRLTTYGERPLETAVEGAGRRDLGDAWAWTRKRSMLQAGTDICPLVAVTCAYWGQLMFGDQEVQSWEGSGSFG